MTVGRGVLMSKAKLRIVAAGAFVVLCPSVVSVQQPGAARGQGGGGFKQPDPIDFNEHEGWTSLFDGKTLNGWSGDSLWKVEDGAITIESTCEKPTGTVYLVWKGGEAEYVGRAVRFRRRKPIHRSVLRAINRPRHHRVEGTGRPHSAGRYETSAGDGGRSGVG